MNLLLDTHVAIWQTISPQKLSEQVRELLLDESNIWHLSLASIWEMQIKLQLGKLRLDMPLPEMLRDLQVKNDLRFLFISLEHIYALENLPHIHRDPFDRMLIAQAAAEKMPIISIDSAFNGYDVQRLW
ncbi:type II toxin-antitoxin system VapC family toxin [Nodosilinea sp. P-1105]|uniref:type II toxin-antitoxin system VapC family toxin n=1 Tax=Nodosilinea sp. P-1105 TaxID=2546229 RepID=UPI00146BC2AD|nr:type II toxin-antitoxin system VapC family toxin [Nodosilinea sp. P-1105]NMF82627.1 type II toxin-antitoxin system VapC family toxin [Nodosilinea sp. P-1105]